ncbi:nucleotide disphospho-sugar-binding domain-containing protein [Nocardia rhamnosiphila]|uniref:glycosyltransferase n=1 Tax=Nocardia rhamnosiphila TaxID=426716 RepID=UPI0033EEE3F3
MARYLLAATPIPGHVGPMLALAKELQRRGHQVRFLTGALFRETAAAQGVLCSDQVIAAPTFPAGRRRSRAPGLLSRWHTGRSELRSGYLDPILGQFHALASELQLMDVDAVFVDVMFTGAIPLLLSRADRPPVLSCGVVPLMLSSADTPPFGMGWQPRPGRDYTAMNWFVQHILFGTGQRRLDAILRRPGRPPMPEFILDWPVLADRLLQFTVPGFEYPRGDLPQSVVFTGPIPIDRSEDTLRTGWSGELSGTKTVVHVTQGTWDNGDLDQLIRPTLTALGGRADTVVVACTGGSRAPLGSVPANAYITDFVPYSQLLPSVDVMITNGGYGGVQQALRCGVPLIVAGDSADKPEIAARVAYTGAGIDLGTAQPRPAAVAAAVDRVLHNVEYRSAAARLAHAMAQMSPFDIISDVLAELGADGSRTEMRSSRREEL